MQRKVLVPVDGLPLAETALPLASRLATAIGASMDLLRVVPAAASASTESEARAYLEHLAPGTPLATARSLMRGDPGQCIVREVRTEDVGLVVMATHARAGVSRAVLGSVAAYVVAHSSAPVLLIPPLAARTTALRTILVAIDRSTAAPLTTVMDLARAVGARVVLLSVIAPEETAIWQWQPGPLLEEPQVVAVVRKQLEDIASRLCKAGVDAGVRVAVGSAARMINVTVAATDADLIVMSTHARTGAQRTVGGSVTDAVVHTTNRPVLACRLVPPPPTEVRQIDLFHALQRRIPRAVPTSIPGPLDAIRHP